MKKHLLIFLFIVLSNALATRSWGQEEKPVLKTYQDSINYIVTLEKQKANTSDSIFIKLENHQLAILKINNASSGNYIEDDVLQIAQKEQLHRLQIMCLNVKASRYLILHNPKKSIEICEENLLLCKKYAPKEVPSNIAKMAQAYEQLSDYETALKKYNEALVLANQLKLKSKIASIQGSIADLHTFYDGDIGQSLNIRKSIIPIYEETNDEVEANVNYLNIAYYYIMLEQADSSIRYSGLSEQIIKKTKNEQAYIVLFQNYAYAYEIKGNWNKALLYYDSTAFFAKKFNNLEKLGAGFTGKSQAYREIGNLQKALAMLDSAEICYNKIGAENLLATVYGNKGFVYFNLKDYKTSKKFFKEALAIFNKIGDFPQANFTMLELGRVEEISKNYGDAEKLYLSAYASFQEMNDLVGINRAKNQLASCYFYVKNYKKAKELITSSLAYAQENKIKEQIQNRALLAAQIDSALGDYKGALAHYKIYAVYTDSLRNKDNTSLVYEYEAKYDNQKLRAEKAEADKNIAEEKAAKQILWFAVMLAASLSVAGFVAYWQQRKRKFIAEQNAEIQKLLAEESTALAEANAQRLEQEQELAQQNEELLVIQESRNAELAKERAHWLAAMREIQDYLSAKKYDTLNTFVVEKMKPVSQNSATELKNILSEMRENFPQFIPNLIAAYPELASRPKLQDLAVLLAKNTPISEVATLLFSGQVGTAKNNQRELRVILNFPAKDYEGVRAYLRTLMYKS